MMPKTKSRVTFVQHRLFHYRVPFYRTLKTYLDNRGIILQLLHGDISAAEQSRRDEGHIGWSEGIENVRISLPRGIEANWQPCLHKLRKSDLVIVQQENKLLINYWLLLKQHLMGKKLAFWGHGMNLQSLDTETLRERWKRLFIKMPYHWFAYTENTARILRNSGYSQEKITVVNNSTDTASMRTYKEDIKDKELDELRTKYGLVNARVGIFCGSLYSHKKIDFLIEAAKRLRASVPDFHLVIVGAGPDEEIVTSAAAKETWIHYVGTQFDRDLVKHMKLAEIFLNPGLVGLSIVDSFVLGLPIVTTDCGLHSPEIEYLVHGKNGLMTAMELEEYVAACSSLLNSNDRLSKMSDRCLLDSKGYSIETMARNFSNGIVKTLTVKK